MFENRKIFCKKITHMKKHVSYLSIMNKFYLLFSLFDYFFRLV